MAIKTYSEAYDFEVMTIQEKPHFQKYDVITIKYKSISSKDVESIKNKIKTKKSFKNCVASSIR
jgi:hypothetical protein